MATSLLRGFPREIGNLRGVDFGNRTRDHPLERRQCSQCESVHSEPTALTTRPSRPSRQGELSSGVHRAGEAVLSDRHPMSYPVPCSALSSSSSSTENLSAQNDLNITCGNRSPTDSNMVELGP